MAKAPAVTKQQATALATTGFSEDLEQLRKQITAPSGNKIKLENKEFIFPDGSKSKELDVVIVDFVYHNILYANGFQKGVAPETLCYSLAVEPTNMQPAANSPELQSESGCDSCPMNQFGSSGEAKACKNRVLIGILPADATEDTPVAILDIPPTSNMKKDRNGFNNYVAAVAGALQRPPYGVRTRISFDPSVTYAKIIFTDPQPFDMEDEDDVAQVNLIRSRRPAVRELLLTPPTLTAANDTAAPKKTQLKTPARRRA